MASLSLHLKLDITNCLTQDIERTWNDALVRSGQTTRLHTFPGSHTCAHLPPHRINIGQGRRKAQAQQPGIGGS